MTTALVGILATRASAHIHDVAPLSVGDLTGPSDTAYRSRLGDFEKGWRTLGCKEAGGREVGV